MPETPTSENSKLIFQGKDIVSIPVGGVPILIGPSPEPFEGSLAWIEVLAQAINFIRCGCPEVVIYSECVGNPHNRSDSEQFHQTIKLILDGLSGKQGSFSMTERFMTIMIYPVTNRGIE